MQKIGDTNKKMFGEYVVAISGYSENEKRRLSDMIGRSFNGLKKVFVSKDLVEKKLHEIFSRDDNYGIDKESYEKKAIIMSGFFEKTLIDFMRAVKSENLSPDLWAVLTPTSKEWEFCDLVEELEKEALEMKKIKEQNTKNI